MEEFPRIKRLPPYIFSITDSLKREARARGEDIIDFGMGNPDHATPQHIVEKLIETVHRGDTHRYSQSKGIPRLRKAICDWYRNRFDVELDSESEAIVTLGSKEGIAHLAMAVLGPGDAVLVPNPSYPVHPYGFVIADADLKIRGPGEILGKAQSGLDGLKLGDLISDTDLVRKAQALAASLISQDPLLKSPENQNLRLLIDNIGQNNDLIA